MKHFFRKHKKIIILIFLIVYPVAYLGARYEKIIVHRVSYMTEQDQSTTYFHNVTRGDFGIPMLTGRMIWIIADICNFVFLPLRIWEITASSGKWERIAGKRE